VLVVRCNCDQLFKQGYEVSILLLSFRYVRVLGEAIGRPDLQWRTFTLEQGYAGLAQQQQLLAPVITQLLELNSAMHNGSMWQGYAQHRPATLGEVKLENFAQEFTAAFQQ
jgi:hypothetical protein